MYDFRASKLEGAFDKDIETVEGNRVTYICFDPL